MKTRSSRTYVLVGTAIMSTLAIVMDLIPLPRLPWGMKIDLVGTIWVLSFFLYGWKSALVVASVTAIYIAMFSNTGYLGAVMKFIATTPMFLVPASMTYLPLFSRRESRAFSRILVIVSATILASIVRMFLATVVNLYWAIPIWYGMTSEQVLAYFGGLIPLITFVAGFNVIQGIIDMLIPWVLAFRLRLVRYFGTW